MPLPLAFHIQVQNGDKPFYPAQKIEGKVILHCQEVMKPRKIHLTLIGRALVYGVGTYPTLAGYEGSQQTHSVNNSNQETYFRVPVDLWVSEIGQEQLHPGTYVWPFSYQLPSVSLPSSYEDSYGNIRYWLHAQIDTPFGVCYTAQFVFTVLECVDLNLAKEDLSLPRRGEEQKTLCCLCCKSDPLTLAVSTNRGGYCAGEKILVTAHLEGDMRTNRGMRVLNATLYRSATFFTHNGTRNSCIPVAKIWTNSVIPAREVYEWNQNQLFIAACPPSSNTCKIIHIEYFVDFVVVVPPYGNSLHVCIPIVIGTKPLRSVYTDTTMSSVEYVKSARSVIWRDTKRIFTYAPLYSVMLPVDNWTEYNRR